MWGHDRAPGSRRPTTPRRARFASPAANGYRRPVQVLDGNYERMSGVCPWWDRVKPRTGAQ